MERVPRTNKHVGAIPTGRLPRFFHPGGVSSFPASWRSFYLVVKPSSDSARKEEERATGNSCITVSPSLVIQLQVLQLGCKDSLASEKPDWYRSSRAHLVAKRDFPIKDSYHLVSHSFDKRRLCHSRSTLIENLKIARATSKIGWKCALS